MDKVARVRTHPRLGQYRVQIEWVKVRVLPDGRMSRNDAARYLGLKTRTLAMWSTLGKGPPIVRVGGRRFYRLVDLDAFIKKG